MKILIHFLCIFAIVSATISPACAFISGKSGTWIEICSGMDIVKVQVANDDIPDMTHQSCEFCFHAYQINGVETAMLSLDLAKQSHMIDDFINDIALIQCHQSYQSRAPPFA